MPAMKRKLNARNEPETSDSLSSPAQPAQKAADPSPKSATPTFSTFGLDGRLLRAVRSQHWSDPTLVQVRAIPLALEGKDILARSGTGTGKTAAYLLPILHNVLRRTGNRETSSLILVPTKELALQVTKVAQSLAAFCDVRVQNLASKESEVVQRAKLADLPQIVVATPARAAANMNNGALSLKSLAHLVVDEGDLVMGYGFKEDLDYISQNIPKGVQIFLMSATLNTDVDAVKGLFCRDPVLLDLGALEKDSQQVKQYVIKCAEEEKFLLAYALFKLDLIKGKTIVFVGDVDRSYRVKLFLEQFGIKACVLNAELPLTSRLHIVEEFNKNIYNILIASDDTEILGTEKKSDESRPRKKAKTDDGRPDFGISRGIDFRNVSCILNFDMPSSRKAYAHRIGRTARAGKSGTAISLVIPKDKFKKHKPTSFLGCENDEKVLEKIEKHQTEGSGLEDYKFDMKRLEPFRYRFADALRAVTRIAVREARVKEIRMELAKSQKLSRYFEEHPDELAHLRHDQTLNHPARIQAHLKHVPDYLLPGGKKSQDIGFVSLNKPKPRRFVQRKGKKVVRGKNGKIDPLKTFNARGRGKK
ncbi:ATP-dependent RNA helicase-like protein dbp9 [Trematosphaeria pertusa]|uniref:RNA helicase n=1 Tax=Trematosphaeria pertusa TaxID=390896 RepID=A0A6A6IQW9_9PLEO|nr:ATP-dependent RNA helicase-like protein dbp9 [Trematosphaeria pertusa]KAF2251923.1 ATP-dependent RNA helicase-like protein dbp9 [Trematosphaeria pertusa]